jgi:hypothetical protein
MEQKYKVFAKRNSATLECYESTYEQWLAKSSSLIENGFMVLVRDELYAMQDTEGNVRFIDEAVRGCAQ